MWWDNSTQAGWVTDSIGDNRRPLAVPPLVIVDPNVGGAWRLAPDGTAMVIAGRETDGFSLVRVPLDGGAAATIGRVGAPEQGLGVAGWLPDGFVYLSRGGSGREGTTLLRLDTTTGNVQHYADLPVRCDVLNVTVAAGGRKATCVVMDERGDVIVFDGLRP